MTVQQSSTSALPGPVRTAASTLGKVPGAGLVGRVAGGAWHRAGALSPRGRRMAVYAGAGVLGVAGVVEWPVAVTGAAVAWLTRPRPEERRGAGPQGAADGVAGSAAHGAAKTSTTGHGARTGQRKGSATWTTRAAGSARAAGPGPATGAGGTAGTARDTDTGPEAPTAARSKGTGPAADAAKSTDTGAADAAKDKDTGPAAGGGAATGTTGGRGTPQDTPAAGARDGTAAPTDGSGSAGSGK
ncbi:hypothetical protein ACF1AO_21705 [Streptomyces longwoodensis]|uniref:hypothetical protein n=1 Tax=Streptomyces longwoodensis TaxID=68231 RepID=UPI0036F9D415